MKIFPAFFLFFNFQKPENKQCFTANEISGKVVKIVDGDTFDLLVENNIQIRVRMNGIDCPGRGQDFYQVAKDTLGAFIFGKEIIIVSHGYDRYNRLLGDVYMNTDFINLKMVSGGYAWHFKKYSSSALLARAEINARDAHLGIWSKATPTPTWEFRHAKKLKFTCLTTLTLGSSLKYLLKPIRINE